MTGGRVPTGVALGDGREQLLAAAGRVLARAGASGLTSRAVTDEAGCAKGVLHRYFVDFDGFLVELVRQRIARLEDHASALQAAVGSATVVQNVVEALVTIFDPVAVNVVALTTSRDAVRRRLREVRSVAGVPLLAEATSMVAAYLVAEQRVGRLSSRLDARCVAPAVIGAGHLLFADRDTSAPSPEALRRSVGAIIGAAGTR